MLTSHILGSWILINIHNSLKLWTTFFAYILFRDRVRLVTNMVALKNVLKGGLTWLFSVQPALNQQKTNGYAFPWQISQCPKNYY